MKKTLSLLFISLLPALVATAQESQGLSALAQNFSVKINGTVRSKFEWQTGEDEIRFQVRNARFSLSGNVTDVVSYKAEIDLSDEGNIKMLDAYGRVNLVGKKLQWTIGQMRVPFTIDAHRSPHEQYFANRSFIAKQVGNVRDVGTTLSWSFGEVVPIILAGGLFNGSGLTDQKDYWTSTLNYSAKAQAFFAQKKINLTLSVQKTHPDIVDIHMYDAGAYFDNGKFHVEAEYLLKTYAKDAFDNVNAIDAFACYNLPLEKSKAFNKISFLGRYDYMSDHSDGEADEDGILPIDDYERHRVTGGITLSLGMPFKADIRLNYEKYFYGQDAEPATSERDKLVLELMIRF